MAQQSLVVTAIERGSGFRFKPFHSLFEMSKLKRSGLLDLRGMHDTDALDHLAHIGRLGWVGESLCDVPLSQRGQPLLERADCMFVGVLGEVANDTVAGGGQVAAPRHFEMLDRSPVALASVFPGACLEVPISLVHHLSPSKNCVIPAFHTYPGKLKTF